MHRLQKEKESYEQARQDVNEELKNHKATVKRDIIDEYVPDASAYQKEILNDVLDDHDHVAQTYHTILLEAQAEFREKYNRQYQNVKQAEKNGVSIPYVSVDGMDSNVITPEAERMRVIAYNRQLEKEGVHNDPEVVLMIDQTYDEMEQASKSIRNIEGLEGAVDKIAKGDVAMRMNFSKDGYQVFQDVYNTLRQSPNREVAKQAKEGAFLFASHADVMANIMQKAGKWDFTAKDYMDRYISIQMGDTKQIKNGFTQQEVLRGEEKLKADTEAWGTLIDSFKANKVTEYRHRVMRMPLVYQMIGMKNKELFIENNILNKVLNTKHGNKYDIKDLKELPVVLANPIAIFKNYDSRTDSVRPNSFIVVVGIKSHNGDLTNIPILFNKNEDGHFILSIFPRENDEWYQQQIKHNRLLYIDRTKKDVILMWRQSGPHAMKMTSIDDSIPNEEDLRKLKEGNPSYYQSQQSGVTKQQVVEAKAKLKDDTANWSKIIDNLDSYDAGMQVRVMTTPLALQLAGAKPYEVVMGVGKIRKIMKEHPEITKAGIKNLIQQLSDPIAVFESKTQKGSIIAMVQLKYPVNNANVIIPLKLNADERNGKYKVNVITSMYSKTNKHTLEPNLQWYINYFEGKAEKACYLNAKKITDWYSSNRLQLPSVEYHISDFFTYTIPNEEDLRKLKEENTSYYQSVRGVTSMYDDGRKLVELFDSANFSTFVHESGHVFLEDLRMLANMEHAPREVVRDWEAVKTWTGYQEGADADTNRTAHEKFAQGFEAYVRDGSAPTKSLQRSFRQFATWLTKLYQKVSMLGGLPPKEIREVMDRMLATEQDIESWANEREVERLETNGHMQNLSEQEQALLHDKVASIKERAKEKVRAEYMKEMEEQKKVPWEDVKGEAQARIEKGLVERYPIYRERARYEAFGI